VTSAFAFNLCLVLLAIAAATALTIVRRDQLYAYEYTQAGARAISARVERLSGELIQLDFDRQRQWDDLVAMELMAGDVTAARGFLLSAPGMLGGRAASQIAREAGANPSDAAIELAALEQLTPGTRARYENTVPLLSRRAASSVGERRDPDGPITLGDQRDFEMLAAAMLNEADADPLQFILTGFGLGLAGILPPSEVRGAAALLAASRRDDYPPTLDTEIRAALSAALPLAAFRAAAMNAADGAEPAAFANASAAFRGAVSAQGVERARAILASIGAMADTASLSGAAALLTHADALEDLPRLQVIAQSAGDRAASAAKRLPRDGRLLRTARGELTMTRELATAMGAAGLAAFGAFAALLFVIAQIFRRMWMRMNDDEDYGGELVDISGASNWRPL